ncbi:hypothetical protein ABPG72_007159 [Tetrahymena utriculariae]
MQVFRSGNTVLYEQISVVLAKVVEMNCLKQPNRGYKFQETENGAQSIDFTLLVQANQLDRFKLHMMRAVPFFLDLKAHEYFCPLSSEIQAGIFLSQKLIRIQVGRQKQRDQNEKQACQKRTHPGGKENFFRNPEGKTKELISIRMIKQQLISEKPFSFQQEVNGLLEAESLAVNISKIPQKH